MRLMVATHTTGKPISPLGIRVSFGDISAIWRHIFFHVLGFLVDPYQIGAVIY